MTRCRPAARTPYAWEVPERAGPGPSDLSSVLRMYHSHVDKPAETNAGLIGPIVITAAGKAKEDGTPVDVDGGFVTLFTVFDENASLYFDVNIDQFTGRPDRVRARRLEDEEFAESNLMHAINGYLFGNLPGLTNEGRRARAMVRAGHGDGGRPAARPTGMATPGLFMGMRMDMLELLPGSMKVFDMQPDDPGTWMYHCHVNDHITAGMLALYTVTP